MNNLSYQDYLDGTARVLEESQLETRPYEVTILGRRFIVYPGVFSPKYFEDTEFFAKEVPKRVNSGEDFSETGGGTGAISIITNQLVEINKSVVTDISEVAFKNLLKNVHLHNLDQQISVRHGNLYEPYESDELFDVAFWNVPFGFVSTENLTVLELAVFDPNYKAIEEWIKQSPERLKPNGRLLIGFSTTLGRFDLLQKFLHETGFKEELVAETCATETHPISLELFEATLN